VRILNYSAGQDTGGQQGRLAQAFRRYAPDWVYDVYTVTKTFYPVERRYNAVEVIREAYPAADVVHVNNDLRYVQRMARRSGPKPYVVHHHGTMYRTAYERHLLDQRRAKAIAIVSTLDLQAIAPDRSDWLPAPSDLDELAAIRAAEYQPGDVLRVAHAPTNRKIKSTDALIAAVDRLRSEGAAIELDVIEKVSNAECMQRKARADVFVDQVILGYGCNAIEAWGMGIPVIAGIDVERGPALIRQPIPASTPELMRSTWGEFPWYDANEATLYDALAAMLDAKVRARYAKRGLAHVRRWHDAPVVVKRAQDIYRRAQKALT
jgi:hypothetical protein